MSLDANGESEPTGRVPANTVATSAVLPQYLHLLHEPRCQRRVGASKVVAGLHVMLPAPAVFG